MSKTPRIIKASQVLGVPPIEFNATDTLDELKRRVAEGNAEIERYRQSVLAEAQALFEAKASEGYAAGYADGLAKGALDAKANHRRELEKEVATRMATAMPTLERLAGLLAEARDQWQGQWERIGLELVCAIAEKVVKEAVSRPSDSARKNLATCLALVGRVPKVTIRVHPRDLETLELERDSLIAHTRAIGGVQWLSDPGLSPGGCRIETEFGAIDADIDTQLARIKDELIGVDSATSSPAPAGLAPQAPT